MPDPVRSIEEYVARLSEALAGADRAVIQDAVYDATEHLRNALAARAAAEPSAPPAEQLAAVLDAFGTPEEVAAAYRETETRVAEALFTPRPAPRSTAERIFGVFIDPHAYGALAYMFLSFLTGIVYFTWVVFGLSFSLGVAILIIGVPVFVLFLGSVRAIALAEGRIVEALLGERMPRRPVPMPPGTLLARIVSWLKDRRSWTTMLYLGLQLPLGVCYFAVFTTLVVLALSFFAVPFVQYFYDGAVVRFGSGPYRFDAWTYPLLWLLGFAILFATLHLARGIGWVHARIAKTLLVARAPAAPAPARAAAPRTVRA